MMPFLQTLQCSATPPQISPTNKTHHRRSHQQWQRHRTQMSGPIESAVAATTTTTHHPLDQIPLTDTFAWNTLLRAHLAEDNPRQAIFVYRYMLLRGARPDRRTLPHVLAASRLSAVLFNGKQVHAHAVKLGLASDPYIVTALMELYARFEGARSASTVFDRSTERNSVSWTLLAKLYMAESKPDVALQVFYQMVDAGAEFDSVALVTASKACGQQKSIHQARKVHEIAKRRGLELDVLVGNSLLKMYLDLECGRIKEARDLFERMPSTDVVSWTTIIRGYVQKGGFNEALKLFRAMCTQGVRPDGFAVSAILPACARMAAHKHGKEIHGHIVRHGIVCTNSTVVHNALMDMYVKSACVDAASKIFERMLEKDAISWTVMILGYSLHGQGELGVELFRQMEGQSRVRPDRAAYAAALHACTAALMVEEGRLFLDRIRNPDVGHKALMVALLSRAGHLDKAQAFVDHHRLGRHAEVLRAMLDGCRIHRNVRLGKRIVEQLIEVDPLNAENYVLLLNVYAANAKWDMVKETRATIRDMGLKPKSGYSWIEVRSKVHVFGVGDVSHPRSERIYWELQGLMDRMEEEEGYVPEEDFSLHDVDQERECIPCGHSEMLAIAFGLISTEGSSTVLVTKNLRVCRNCHASIKLISKIVGREIVLKDPDRFHHFRNGSCSCRDFW